MAMFIFTLGNSGFVRANPADLTPNNLAIEFKKSVFPHLDLPLEDVSAYSNKLENYMLNSNVRLDWPQYLVLIDRNKNIQVAMIFFWGGVDVGWRLIGASPVSTGRPGTFDHFLTPLGIFAHSLDNLDFRAEGTKNKFGFRGYGIKGMRVYDFGWVNEPRGWGDGKMAFMRLQMHATDPNLAEHLLGVPNSKGCIRISASMNEFIDRYGLLDADYDLALEKKSHFWVLRHDRVPTRMPGRYLIVIDSNTNKRPSWSPLPIARK